jgi:hypothetical protein
MLRICQSILIHDNIELQFTKPVYCRTPGRELENYLNTRYGPGNHYYDRFVSLIQQGIKNNEGWVAVDELDGPRYRRSRLCAPSAETRFFSITTVYMNSQEEYSGTYHQHPYGEINCVIQLDPGAELKGMSGWQGTGWTSPGPGTHHYPEVRNGALVALVFLPAGRISFSASPDMPQPHCV